MTRRTRSSRAGAAAACVALACLWYPAGLATAVVKSEAVLQLEFGVKMALMGSWKEAAFRFEKAIQAGGATARAWNNLAVAREHLGLFDGAREAYGRALELDPQDRRIRENYERFVSYSTAQAGSGGK